MSCSDHISYATGRARPGGRWAQPPLPFDEPLPDDDPPHVDHASVSDADLLLATYVAVSDVAVAQRRADGVMHALRAEADELTEQVRALTFTMLGTVGAGLVLAAAVVGSRFIP